MQGRVVWVTGGGGWVGQALLPLLHARGATVLAPRSHELDITDNQAVRAFTRTHRPEAIINLAAAGPLDDEQRQVQVNGEGAKHVAYAAMRLHARLVHVSSDVVLDGRSAPYDDNAPAVPLTFYGRSKAYGEASILMIYPQAVCVRTSLSWDPAAIDRGTGGFAERLAAGEPCKLFTDEIRCPLPRTVLAECLVRLVDVPVNGTLNVAGHEALSRYQFGLMLLRHFRVPGIERVQACKAEDLELRGEPRRPRDLTLRVGHAEMLTALPLPGVSDLLGTLPNQ
ncbi:MAG: sugar nucleotide-binding protein [Planctomycetota bacterium]|nr:sugar nucleotide-binding protein [Planctomycetota bacterium]